MDWYINLKCKKCGRYVGVVRRAVSGQEKVVGCKQCGISMNITMKDQQHIDAGDLIIDTGYYYNYDS